MEEKIVYSAERSSNSEHNPSDVKIDYAAEARVRRKLDRHLMPLVFVLYMLAFLDRGNIGNARIAGMAKELELLGDRYDWLLTIFYISYITFEWTLLLWKVYPPHIVAATIVFLWGLMSTLQAAASNWSGVMALRFFLGIFEAAYGPGVIYLLSFFYFRNEIGLRCGIFVAAAPLASTFAGALAYGITSGHSRLANWRLLFLVEGLPTLIMAPVTYFFLPDSPDTAKFLSEEERAVAKSRAIRQAGSGKRTGTGGLNIREVLKTWSNFRVWITAVMYFSANVSYASLPVFLPTILEDMGYNGIDAQGLSAPPNFMAFFAAIAMAWLADKYQQRGLALCFSGIVGGIGYLILATVDTTGVKYFATFLAAGGVFSTIPNINAWVMNNQGSDSGRGAGLVLINVIGQCGPILGTRIYPLRQKPHYIEGMSICAAFMFFSACLAVCLRFLLAWENKKLDRQWGESGKQASDMGEVAEENYDNPSFRFVL